MVVMDCYCHKCGKSLLTSTIIPKLGTEDTITNNICSHCDYKGNIKKLKKVNSWDRDKYF